MLRYVCDVCGNTADNVLPGTWATVQVIVATPPTGDVLPDPAPPTNPMPLVATKHVCDQHTPEALFTQETK